jgi:predicted DNA-binding protein with PD1-like motif
VSLWAGAQTPEYVPPSKTPEPGTAPNVKIQLLTKPGQQPAEYAVIFGKGDEVTAGLLDFASKYHVQSGHFTGIGAIQDARLGWLDRERKAYRIIPVTSQVEVVSMVGDFSEYNGKPVIHAHVVVSGSDGTTRGGHLIQAHVFPTLEVMVTVDPVGLKKTPDPETGLTLIDPTKP